MLKHPDVDRASTIRLRILKRGRVVRSFRVKAKTLTIGSGERASVRIKGVNGLAPEHALVWLDDGAPTLVPSSGHVVMVNGAPTQFARLQADDTVAMGDLELQVEAADVPVPVVVPRASEPEATRPEPWPVSEPAAEGAFAPADDREPTIPDLQLTHQMMQELSDTEEIDASSTVDGSEAASGTGDAVDDMGEAYEDLKTAPYLAASPAMAPPASAAFAEPSLLTPSDDAEWDIDDDEDDDELDFVEPFSLVDHLRQKVRAATTGPRESYVVAQVVRHSEGRVWDVTSVLPGQTYSTGLDGGEDHKLLEMGHDGTCLLAVRSGIEGSVGHGESESSVQSLLHEQCTEGLTRLGEGDWANLETGTHSYIIQVMRPARTAPPSMLSTVMGMGFLLVYAFAVTATLGGGALAFASLPEGDRLAVDDGDVEVVEFNRLAMIPPNIDIAEDEPVEPEEAEISDTPDTDTEPVRGPPAVRRRPLRSGQPSKGGGAASALLSHLRGGGSSSGSALDNVITTIDQIGSSAPGVFGITGISSSMPDGTVKIARKGGPGGIGTLPWEKIRSGNPEIGIVQPPPDRPRKIRHKVIRTPPRTTGPGELDPRDVRRVIDRQIGAITRCYESRLLTNPGLGGRVVFGWTVTASGGTSGVRVRSSTIGDSRVANCVSRVIRRLRFPRPRGGPAHISYPFIFRSYD